jgi:hypothetical protein
VPNENNGWASAHVDLLLESYTQLTGSVLYEGALTGAGRARAIFTADFALLSHGLGDDPLFNYANQCALDLFELDWPQLLATPSRESAESANQAARERFMQSVAEKGFASNYSGVRISHSGRRFTINNATVWNVGDAVGVFRGQAATFASWAGID